MFRFTGEYIGDEMRGRDEERIEVTQCSLKSIF